MFEINLFNSAQIFDQIFAFVCVYLLTSLSAKVRFYGFVVGTIGFVPVFICSLKLSFGGCLQQCLFGFS